MEAPSTGHADQVISREQLRSKLLPVAPDRYRAIITAAAGTGLRWREAAGLQLDALDLKRGHLSAIRTVVKVAGHTSFKPYPKSSAGRRTVLLPGWLVPIIRESSPTRSALFDFFVRLADAFLSTRSNATA